MVTRFSTPRRNPPLLIENDVSLSTASVPSRGYRAILNMATRFLGRECELEELQALVSGGLTRSGSPRVKGAA